MISQKIQVGQILYSYFYKGNTFIVKQHRVDKIDGSFIIINELRNRYDLSSLMQEHFSHDSPMQLFRSEKEIIDNQEFQNLSRYIQNTIERGGCLNLDKARRINSILLEKNSE